MDILSYQKGMKAKKELKNLHKRLGATDEYKAGDTDIKSTYLDTDERLDTLEANNPGDVIMNRVSAIEANTHINLNKHNLQMESMLKAESFRHQNMVFDDLSDATGIDAIKSVDILHDATVGKIGIATGKESAEVVTVVEELTETPTMVALSFTGNSNNKNKVSLDFTKGTHSNTEIVDGKIQLKKVGEVGDGYTDNVIPVMTSNTLPSGVIKLSGNSVTGYKTFDGRLDTYATVSGGVTPSVSTPAWISYEFPEARSIQRYKIHPYTETDGARPTSWKFQASNDEISWTTLDECNNSSYGVQLERTFSNPSKYKIYRFYVTGVSSGNTYSRLSEIEMMESAAQDLYSRSGLYESSVVDLGENFKLLYKLDSTITAPEETSLKVSVASSNDGVSFTAYKPINTDGTIATSPGRYVKVRVELVAGGSAKETLVHDFLELEKSDFQENEYVLFDGSAKLKTEYSYNMKVDSEFANSGTLLRKMIQKNNFRSVERVEVKL